MPNDPDHVDLIGYCVGLVEIGKTRHVVLVLPEWSRDYTVTLPQSQFPHEPALNERFLVEVRRTAYAEKPTWEGPPRLAPQNIRAYTPPAISQSPQRGTGP